MSILRWSSTVRFSVSNFDNGWSNGSIVEKDNWDYNNDGRLETMPDGNIQFDIDDANWGTTKSVRTTTPVAVNADVEVIASWGSKGMRL
jgi:hypothetical protein